MRALRILAVVVVICAFSAATGFDSSAICGEFEDGCDAYYMFDNSPGGMWPRQIVPRVKIIDFSRGSAVDLGDRTEAVIESLNLPEPVILRNVPDVRQHWTECFEKWNRTDYWIDECSTFPLAVSDPLNGYFFYYDRQAPFVRAAQKEQIAWVQPYTVHSSPGLSARKFFKRAQRGDLVAFSGNVEFCESALRDVAGGYQALPSFAQRFAVGEKTQRTAQPRSPGTNVWISARGVVSRLHYDSADNLYTQISGTKRFVLWPASVWNQLNLFPHGHPLHRRTQLNPESLTGLTKHATVALLQPGDTLFVPAFTFHHVTALELSVSVATYLPTLQKQRFFDVVHATSHWTRPDSSFFSLSFERQQSVVRVFVHRLVVALYNFSGQNYSNKHDTEDVDVRHFVQHKLRSEFSLERDPVLPGSKAIFGVAHHRDHKTNFCQGSSLDPDDLLLNEVDELVAQIALALQDLVAGARDMACTDLISEVVGNLVGVENVFGFLDACFA